MTPNHMPPRPGATRQLKSKRPPGSANHSAQKPRQISSNNSNTRIKETTTGTATRNTSQGPTLGRITS